MLVVYLGFINRLEEAKSKINDLFILGKDTFPSSECPLTSLPKACLCLSVCDLNEIFLFYGSCQKVLCASLVLNHHQLSLACRHWVVRQLLSGYPPHSSPASLWQAGWPLGIISIVSLSSYELNLANGEVALLVGSQLADCVPHLRVTASIKWSTDHSSLVNTASPALFRYKDGD